MEAFAANAKLVFVEWLDKKLAVRRADFLCHIIKFRIRRSNFDYLLRVLKHCDTQVLGEVDKLWARGVVPVASLCERYCTGTWEVVGYAMSAISLSQEDARYLGWVLLDYLEIFKGDAASYGYS